MIYLNWNIERVENVLMDSATIRKISAMRAADMDMGSSSIAGIVSVRVFQPDYEVKISYSQEGSHDNYKETEALHLELERYNIFDELEDVKPAENGYYDEYNKETISWDEAIEIALENTKICEDTKQQIKSFLDEIKENAVRCPVCGSTNIRKAGHKDLIDGVYQEYECKNRDESHPPGLPRKFRAEWKF